MYNGIEIKANENDGLALLLALSAEYALAHVTASGDEFIQEFSERIQTIISRLSGPFSFILYDQLTQYIWFGRDVIGRRSLLTRTVMYDGCAAFCAASVAPPLPVDSGADAQSFDGEGRAEATNCSDESDHLDEENSRALSSAGDTGWVEVAPSGIWRLHLEHHLGCIAAPHALLFPWILDPPLALPFASNDATMCAEAVLSCLAASVSARTLLHSGSCGIGILFSGGLDCMIIAALTARCVAEHSVVDLFNVAFDAAEAPDRDSACAGVFITMLLPTTNNLL